MGTASIATCSDVYALWWWFRFYYYFFPFFFFLYSRLMLNSHINATYEFFYPESLRKNERKKTTSSSSSSIKIQMKAEGSKMWKRKWWNDLSGTWCLCLKNGRTRNDIVSNSMNSSIAVETTLKHRAQIPWAWIWVDIVEHGSCFTHTNVYQATNRPSINSTVKKEGKKI